ncbi:Mo25-like protein [Kipferlia bialata]|uniref:Mo25-like protein n=1 Tax=Kipferlia bialata TaxID=797122 RepID=A0A9K3CZ54_9EUKA|nr:Mo25-like protein [Kipferlia bialata]|eukprot:g7356.t1
MWPAITAILTLSPLSLTSSMTTMTRPSVAAFLHAHYDTFFEAYGHLIESESYVTRRQSLKLLSDILLDRVTPGVRPVMMRFVASPSHLKLIMEQLRDPSEAIQVEAFHVFKIFAANPTKEPEIVRFLTKNKVKLLNFLSGFQVNSTDDVLVKDKGYVVSAIRGL